MEVAQRRNILIAPIVAVLGVIGYAIVQLVMAYSQGQEAFKNLIDSLARTPISQITLIVVVASLLRLLFHQMLKDIPKHQQSGIFSVARVENEILDAIVYALVFVFMVIRPFMVQAFTIPSPSMYPTLMPSDYIVANKAIYRYSDPKRGDIIVFKPPIYGIPPRQRGQDMDYIKRLIGLPGETVEIRNNIVYINGQALNEPYKGFSRETGVPNIVERAPESEVGVQPDFKLVEHNGEIWPVYIRGDHANDDPHITSEKYLARDEVEQEELRNAPLAKIPAGHYLMMGDNRNGSYDGRSWGLIDRDAIIGRSEFIWFPLSRWGRTR
jgi:signal peptidase I